MSTKQAQEAIVENMSKWQRIEKASILSTSKVLSETENPVISLVMEIIQRDSQTHYRIQELIKDSLTTKALTLTPDELGRVWSLIEKHIELERQTVDLAKSSLAAIEGKKGLVIQAYLLEYLLKDEEKHDAVLDKLEEIKKGMYPYG
jgi:hypothetical protein